MNVSAYTVNKWIRDEDPQLTLLDNPVVADDASIADVPVDTPMATVQAATVSAPMPQIITRAQWGADESLRTGTTTYSSSGTIKVAFIHHVVSSNDYSPAEAAAEMRNIYSWFTTGIGCYDFGYNFMIDRYGRLYEGRAGSIDKPVVGAHTSGFNDQTFAVSFLGNSDTLNPTKAEGEKILTSIARLIAWKFSIYKVNPYGTTVLTSAGPGPGARAASAPGNGSRAGPAGRRPAAAAVRRPSRPGRARLARRRRPLRLARRPPVRALAPHGRGRHARPRRDPVARRPGPRSRGPGRPLPPPAARDLLTGGFLHRGHGDGTGVAPPRTGPGGGKAG